jgi:hypothetical protein
MHHQFARRDATFPPGRLLVLDLCPACLGQQRKMCASPAWEARSARAQRTPSGGRRAVPHTVSLLWAASASRAAAVAESQDACSLSCMQTGEDVGSACRLQLGSAAQPMAPPLAGQGPPLPIDERASSAPSLLHCAYMVLQIVCDFVSPKASLYHGLIPKTYPSSG